MKKLLILCSILLLAVSANAATEWEIAQQQEQQEIYAPETPTRDFSQRIVFDKYVWAEGVDPSARFLNLLMVKFFDEDTVRLRNGQLTSLAGRDLSVTKSVLARHPEIKPRVIIWNKTEEEYMANLARIEKKSGWDLVDLFSFYCFELPEAPADPKALINEVLRAPEVETAYYEPIPIDLTCQDLGNTTPDFTPNQTYHDAAPTGVDLDWVLANHNPDIVDGPGTNRWTGIFERGMQTTHEDLTLATVATAGTPDTDNDHGTAVTGVIGACDDNNVGCLGFVADQQMRLYQRNSSSYGSTADIYDLATSDLVSGEFTNSSWGYGANPLPPGQTCPCNPGQNGVVNPEYNAGVKSAILAMVADGIHVFLAAGNGCTNLDDATFGTIFRNSTDTGSNYVSACSSDVAHNASCFTNWGERCDLNAWGDGSFTLGYNSDGTPFVPATRDEWYTNGFNGTSNASPTVAGCAGVIHNIVRSYNGTIVSTSLMRDYLNDYGTLPGTTPGNIGRMPNLKGILAPELNPDLRSGWSYYMVARTTNDADGSNCTYPTDLNPDPSATYWNAAQENTARIGWGVPTNYTVYRDDIWTAGWTHDTLHAGQTSYGTNLQSNVRGGRHFVRLTVDPNDLVDELYETNNSAWAQWAWDPRQFTNGQVLTLSAPPTKYVTDQLDLGYTYPNVDGYGGANFATDGYWDIMMVMAQTSTADFDARIYSEDVTRANGFDDFEASSGYVSYCDFVGVNNNIVGYSAPLIGAVMNYDGESSQYRVECGSSTVLSPAPTLGRTDYGPFSLTSSELFDVVEFYVGELVPYNIEAVVTSGNANLVLSVYGPDDLYFSRASFNAQANFGGAGESEMISCWTPAETGWHSIVMHKHTYADWDQSVNFNLYVGKAAFDFVHTLGSGWSDELVVRQTTGGQPAVVPATLTGNISTNYVNILALNQGCGSAVASLDDQVHRNGPVVGTFPNWNGPIVPGSAAFGSNRNIGTVPGGRHEIANVIDYLDEGTEWNENNNRYDVQYVWTPAVLANNTMLVSPNVAPNWRDLNAIVNFPDWAVDGFRFTGGGFWSGVGMMPNDNVYDVNNLFLYAPATSSTVGFQSPLVNSWTSAADVEWVLENGNNIASETFDVGVHNNWAWPGDTSHATYRMQQSDRIQDLQSGQMYGEFPFPATQIINVFDLYLNANETTRILLDNRGAGDLGFAVYNPSLLYGSRSSFTAQENTNGDGADEELDFTPTETGWHGFVVFKNDRSDLNTNPYALVIGDRQPAAPDSLVIKWVQSTPNYYYELSWAPVTQDIYGQPLTVDTYYLMFTYDLDAVYPTGWALGGATLMNHQLPIYPNISEDGFKLVVLAVDANGFVLSESSAPDEAASLVGRRIEDIRAEVAHEDLLTPKSNRSHRE
ncbi:MAG: S8 family serine peptidase [Calditrichaeota bacterium]|nr:S8 family serine peptidase [Calditrichota bacterium]MCB9368943.1 S8 family serine peptidase [Calditrichota bacterium]